MRPDMAPVLLLAGLLACAAAKQIVVGGPEEGWTRGRVYEPLEAEVGDELVFTWTPGQHNVAELPTGSCEGAADAAVLFGITAEQPAVVKLEQAGNRTFACSLPSHCDNGQIVTVHVGLPAGADEHQSKFKIMPGVGSCDDAVLDEATGMFTRACYSPNITLAPGQIMDELYILPSPFPSDKTVGAVHHMSNIVEGGTGRIVPLSEVYLHHVFADGSFLVGEGAEHAGSKLHPELQEPYYSVIPAGKFDSNESRLVNIHIISTLGVPPEKLMPCIECWCPPDVAETKGKHGGGACCDPKQCPSTVPNTTLVPYQIQYTVKYRELEAGRAVSPVKSFMMDNAGGVIEYDVRATDSVPEGAETLQLLSKTGPIDARCPQTKPLRLVNCLGHLHIGGDHMQLVNTDTGEVYCRSNATYGQGSREDLGNEGGYLVAMSMQARDEPVIIPPGTNVTMVAAYRPEDHFGVMALMFLGLADFDFSCPGPASPATPENYTAFGPRHAASKFTAFGFYEGLSLGRHGPGDAPTGGDILQDDAAEVEESKQDLSGARNGFVLAGFVFGVLLVGAAIVAAVALARRRRLSYSKLHTESTTDTEA